MTYACACRPFKVLSFGMAKVGRRSLQAISVRQLAMLLDSKDRVEILVNVRTYERLGAGLRSRRRFIPVAVLKKIYVCNA